MDNTIVSVLMTAYNREKYISEAIESILNSTYPHFELIIVDDASTDDTFSIALAFSKKDNRIKVFRNEQNLGDYANRNKAASYAQGKYIKYVDSDDGIHPHCLETMLAMMEAFPKAGLGISVPEDSKINNFPICLNKEQVYRLHYYECPVFFASPGRVIFKRQSFDEIGGFKPLRMIGDFEMWHRMALDYNVVLLPAGLNWYRKHENQEVKDFSRFLTQYEQIKVSYLKCSRSPFSQQEAKKIIAARKLNLLKIFLRFVATLKWKSASHRLNVLFFYLRNGY